MNEEIKEFTPAIDATTTTVQEMFGQVLQKRIQEGVLEQAIAKNVDKMIDYVADDVFGRYSDIGKTLKEQMVKAITPNLDTLCDLPGYNDFVMSRLKLAAKEFHDQRLAQVIDKELEAVFSEIPKEVTLSWLVGKLVELSSDEDSYEGGVTLIIDNTEYSWGSSLSVYFDKEEGVEKRSCDYDLHLSKDKDTGKYKILGLRVNGDKADNTLSLGRMYGMDKILFNIYAMKGLIDIDKGLDAEDYDTTWCRD